MLIQKLQCEVARSDSRAPKAVSVAAETPKVPREVREKGDEHDCLMSTITLTDSTGIWSYIPKGNFINKSKKETTR